VGIDEFIWNMWDTTARPGEVHGLRLGERRDNWKRRNLCHHQGRHWKRRWS
jgi:hypothetical protein